MCNNVSSFFNMFFITVPEMCANLSGDIIVNCPFLTLGYWPLYIREREGEEEVGSGDPTSLPCPFESRAVIGPLIPKQTWRTQRE